MNEIYSVYHIGYHDNCISLILIWDEYMRTNIEISVFNYEIIKASMFLAYMFFTFSPSKNCVLYKNNLFLCKTNIMAYEIFSLLLAAWRILMGGYVETKQRGWREEEAGSGGYAVTQYQLCTCFPLFCVLLHIIYMSYCCVIFVSGKEKYRDFYVRTIFNEARNP